MAFPLPLPPWFRKLPIFIVNKRTDTWIYNLCDATTSKSGQFDNLLFKKQIDVSFSCICSVDDNEFRHNIVKIVCRSTATLPMVWRNSWPITGQTNKKLTWICWRNNKAGLQNQHFPFSLKIDIQRWLIPLFNEIWNSQEVFIFAI